MRRGGSIFTERLRRAEREKSDDRPGCQINKQTNKQTSERARARLRSIDGPTWTETVGFARVSERRNGGGARINNNTDTTMLLLTCAPLLCTVALGGAKLKMAALCSLSLESSRRVSCLSNTCANYY